MLGIALRSWLRMLTPLRHGCPSAGANVSNTLEQDQFIDAGICPYADLLTLPVFSTIVLVGIVNVPIYLRQDSALIPFLLTLTLGGVFITQASGLLQTLVAVVVTLVFGIGPVLLIRRIQN